MSEFYLSNIERETVILFNEAEKTARVDTCNVKMKRQLIELNGNRPEDCKLIRQEDYSVVCDIPKTWVKIRANRILSEEQKIKRSELAKRNLHRT